MKRYAAEYAARVQWDAEDAIYIAWAEEMPTVRVHGDTRAEALSVLEEALSFVIEDMIESGDPVPPPRHFAHETRA